MYTLGDNYEESKLYIQINFDNFQKFKEDDDIISEFRILNTKKYYVGVKSYLMYHINLEGLVKKYYNKEKLDYLEKSLLLICLDSILELDNLSIGDDTLMDVKNNLEDLSKNLDFLLVYDEEEERERVYQARMKTELKQGREKALKEGREEGKKELKVEIIKNMINQKFSDDQIIACTNCTKELINDIRNNMI